MKMINAAVGLNDKLIGKHPERISKMKPFTNKFNPLGC